MFRKWLAIGVCAVLCMPGLFSVSNAQQPEQVTNSIGMKFRLLPAGTFVMGSKTSEKNSDDDEREHEVTISQPFYLGIYEVTQEQYLNVMKENPSDFQGENAEGKIPSEKDPQTGRTIVEEKIIPRDTSKYPVEDVSWEEAFEFCKRLSALPDEQKAGRVYRLPREAEWEYACRAGTQTTYFFGDNDGPADLYAWYEKNSKSEYQKYEPWEPHPVGTKKPNAWGIYDLCGNVSEWCFDSYGEYPAGPVTDPSGPGSGSSRVFRGGSFGAGSHKLRSADRDHWDSGSATRGFRVLMLAASDRDSSLAGNLVGKWELDADESRKLLKLSSDSDVEALRQAKVTFEFSKDNAWVISGNTAEKEEGKFEIVDSSTAAKTLNLRMESEDRNFLEAKIKYINDDLILMENQHGSWVLRRVSVSSSPPSFSSPEPLEKLRISQDDLAKLNQFLSLEREVDEIIKKNNILVTDRLPSSEIGDEYLVYLKSGTPNGSVWGSGPYTLDSNLRSAAIHAGVLPPGGSGVVRVVCVKSPDSFSGSSRNGVSSSSYGSYEIAFQIYGLADGSDAANLK
jgi:formylglycine-generating enzyme required for sulfatase activity